MATKATSRDTSDLSALELLADPQKSARAAGLRYVHDTMKGIHRERIKDGFRYLGTDQQPIENPKELERIQHLGIPPAWEDVWISPTPRGHLQATGRDAKGRKQYRYHPKWRSLRDETKYTKMIAFGEALPLIRARVDHDLSLHGLTHDKALAVVVRLLDTTSIRVGNEEYARDNGSYGLTTLQHEHVEVKGNKIHFEFRGKSGKDHAIDVRDKKLAQIVKRFLDLPGYELFQYLDEHGVQRTVDSESVNAYLHEACGVEFTAKDFRTWAGTVTMTEKLQEIGQCENKTQCKHNLSEAVKVAADHLGNTPTICRKCYVHPTVIEAYEDHTLLPFLENQRKLEPVAGLEPRESAVLNFLKARLHHN